MISKFVLPPNHFVSHCSSPEREERAVDGCMELDSKGNRKSKGNITLAQREPAFSTRLIHSLTFTRYYLARNNLSQ